MVTQYVSLFSGLEFSFNFFIGTDTWKNVFGDINIRTQVSKTCPPFTEPLIYVGNSYGTGTERKKKNGTPQTFCHLHRMTIFYKKGRSCIFFV